MHLFVPSNPGVLMLHRRARACFNKGPRRRAGWQGVAGLCEAVLREEKVRVTQPLCASRLPRRPGVLVMKVGISDEH